MTTMQHFIDAFRPIAGQFGFDSNMRIRTTSPAQWCPIEVLGRPAIKSGFAGLYNASVAIGLTKTNGELSQLAADILAAADNKKDLTEQARLLRIAMLDMIYP